MNTREKDQAYVSATYRRFPVQIVGGKGSLLRDETGKEYIDMGSGIAVNTFGTADEEWIAAVCAQLNRFQHTSNLFYTEPCATLAEMLCQRTGMKKVFFANSGAEANECAIKAARKYHEDKADGRSTIITLKDSFHGRTVTTLSATGQEVFHQNFHPLTAGFVHTDADDTQAFLRLADEVRPAAVLLELVQGEGGVRVLDAAFVQAVESYCKANDALLIIDEVQTGNGRTGKLYAYMHYGLTPDLITTAKGLAGGLPLGAVLFGPATADVLGPGSHGSTFGANPVCCAGAINVLSRIDEELLEGVRQKSDYIRRTLSGRKGIRSVSGMGLMLGIETERSAADVLADCRERGLLALSAKTKVRLLPPLNIPFDCVEKAVSILLDVCAG